MARHLQATGEYTYCAQHNEDVRTTKRRWLSTCRSCWRVRDLLDMLDSEMTEWQLNVTIRMMEMYRP